MIAATAPALLASGNEYAHVGEPDRGSATSRWLREAELHICRTRRWLACVPDHRPRPDGRANIIVDAAKALLLKAAATIR